MGSSGEQFPPRTNPSSPSLIQGSKPWWLAPSGTLDHSGLLRRSQYRGTPSFWLFRHLGNSKLLAISSSPPISGDQILHIPESNRGLLEPRMSVGGVLTVYLLYGLSWSYSYKVAARSVCSEERPCLPLSQCEKMGMIIDQIQTNRTVLQSQHGLYNNSFPRSGISSEKIPAAFKGMRPKFVARQQRERKQ